MNSDDIGVLDAEPIVPQIFHQLGLLVLDGSGSMAEKVEGRMTKAEAVNVAVRELLTRLIASKNRKDFSIAIVTFDDEADIHTPVTRVYDDAGNSIDDNADYDP
jgi:Mg-chelatase subunit ChlD